MNSHVHLNKRAGVPNLSHFIQPGKFKFQVQNHIAQLVLGGGQQQASILRLIYQLSDIGRKQVTGTM
jgi:hypothetical protein